MDPRVSWLLRFGAGVLTAVVVFVALRALLG
jgi:hypothetical protein